MSKIGMWILRLGLGLVLLEGKGVGVGCAWGVGGVGGDIVDVGTGLCWSGQSTGW